MFGTSLVPIIPGSLTYVLTQTLTYVLKLSVTDVLKLDKIMTIITFTFHAVPFTLLLPLSFALFISIFSFLI